MSDIKIFENSTFGSVRVIMCENDPWFVAADVCECLEHSNPSVAIEGLDEDEKGIDKSYTPDGTQDMLVISESGLPILVISESGLYILVTRSDKPEAKDFRRWVTHDVLPSIRKTGEYVIENFSEILLTILLTILFVVVFLLTTR